MGTDYDKQKAALDAIVQENANAVQSLRAYGHGLNAEAVLQRRLEALIEHLFGEDGPDRVEFELAFEQAMAPALKSAIAAAAVSALVLPGGRS